MSNTNSKGSLSAYLIAIAGAMCIMAYLVSVMKSYVAAPPTDAVRVAERTKALAEVRTAAEAELHTYAQLNATKAVYRLKVSHAMALTEELYRNPQAARSNLTSRAVKANAEPPPVVFE